MADEISIPPPAERPLVQPECSIELSWHPHLLPTYPEAPPKLRYVTEGKISLRWINTTNPEDPDDILQVSIDDANGYDVHTVSSRSILEDLFAQAHEQAKVMRTALNGGT